MRLDRASPRQRFHCYEVAVCSNIKLNFESLVICYGELNCNGQLKEVLTYAIFFFHLGFFFRFSQWQHKFSCCPVVVLRGSRSRCHDTRPGLLLKKVLWSSPGHLKRPSRGLRNFPNRFNLHFWKILFWALDKTNAKTTPLVRVLGLAMFSLLVK